MKQARGHRLGERGFPDSHVLLSRRWNSIAVPTVLRISSYRLFFASSDRGEPPHVHVSRESMVAKVWLDPVVVDRAGGFKRIELNTSATIVQKYQLQLIESWHEFFGH